LIFYILFNSYITGMIIILILCTTFVLTLKNKPSNI
jgi:hypothetical protein